MRRASELRRLTTASNIIADRLRLARRLHDPPLTLQALSALIEARTGHQLSKTMLIRIEGNRRSVFDYEVRAIAEALALDVRYLMGLSDQPR